MRKGWGAAGATRASSQTRDEGSKDGVGGSIQKDLGRQNIIECIIARLGYNGVVVGAIEGRKVRRRVPWVQSV